MVKVVKSLLTKGKVVKPAPKVVKLGAKMLKVVKSALKMGKVVKSALSMVKSALKIVKVVKLAPRRLKMAESLPLAICLMASLSDRLTAA